MAILISIAVLAFILTLIIASIAIASPDIIRANLGVVSAAGKLMAREPITAQDLVDKRLMASDFVGSWHLSQPSSLSSFPWLVKQQLRAKQSNNHQQQQQQDTLIFSDSYKNIVKLIVSQEKTNLSTRQNYSHLADETKLKSEILVTNHSSINLFYDYSGYLVSPSQMFILFWTNKKKLYRYSSTSNYHIYNIKTDTSVQITVPIARAIGDPITKPAINRRHQLVSWYQSPSGRDALIIVSKNNLYYTDSVLDSFFSSQTSKTMVRQLTFTGHTSNGIQHGIADWLYEEEIFSDTSTFQVSPNGRQLAYLSFDDSQVAQFPIIYYSAQQQTFDSSMSPGEDGATGASIEGLPVVQTMRYSRAGRPNARVTLNIASLDTIVDDTNVDINKFSQSTMNIRIELPKELESQQYYLTEVRWLSSDKLAVAWSSRSQQDAKVLICNTKQVVDENNSDSFKCKVKLSFTEKFGWISMFTNKIASYNESHFLIIARKYEDPFIQYIDHLALVSYIDNNFKPTNLLLNNYTKSDNIDKNLPLMFLTSGNMQVIEIYGIDYNEEIVYFLATGIDEPGERHLFSVQVNNRQQVTCITCDINKNGGCRYNAAQVSPSAKYFVFHCLGPDVPRFELRQLHLSLKSTVTDNELRESTLQSDVRQTYSVQKQRLLNEQVHTGLTRPLPNTQTSSVLWNIDSNDELRFELNEKRAMPVQVRLTLELNDLRKTRARVLLLLPPPVSAHSPESSLQQSIDSSSFHEATAQSSSSSLSRLRLATFAQQVHRRQQLPLPSDDQLTSFTPFYSHLSNISQVLSDYKIELLANEPKFPLLIDVYAGPESQKVNYNYDLSFGYYFASSKRIAYASIDARGSGFEGSARSFELFGKLGSIEVDDQLSVARMLTSKLDSILDSSRVGIWGWSYGGYVAALALARSNLPPMPAPVTQLQSTSIPILQSTTNSPSTSAFTKLLASIVYAKSNLNEERNLNMKQNDNNNLFANSNANWRPIFECAASVAPVTDWLLYDSTYTERFLSSPFKNELYDMEKFNDHCNCSSQIDINISKEENVSSFKNETNNKNCSNKSDINERYINSSLLKYIKYINKRRYLLIHGTGDDNVHFEQSLKLMKTLSDSNVLFETQLYADENHSLGGIKNRLHLSLTLSHFFTECFDSVLT